MRYAWRDEDTHRWIPYRGEPDIESTALEDRTHYVGNTLGHHAPLPNLPKHIRWNCDKTQYVECMG